MNSSYDEVLQQSMSTWIFQRVELVLEFSRKQITPVPFNIILIFFQVLKQLFRLSCSRARWCSVQIIQKSDLDQLQDCFGGEHLSDFADMHHNDQQMASLYHDVYGEYSWVRDLFEKGNIANTSSCVNTEKADYMRSCAEIVTVMCAKRMCQEQDYIAKLQRWKSRTENDWGFDQNDVQLVPRKLQQRIGNVENAHVQNNVEDIKSHITTVSDKQFASVGKKLTPIRKSPLLRPLPQGAV